MSKDSSTLAKQWGERGRRSPQAASLRVGRWLLGGVAVGWLLWGLIAQISVEHLWFNEVGYPETFWQPLLTQTVIGLMVTSCSALFLLSNMRLANWLKSPARAWTEPPSPRPHLNEGHPLRAASLSLRWLLPLTIALALGISGVTWHYGQAAIHHWQNAAHSTEPFPLLPDRLGLDHLGQSLQQAWQSAHSSVVPSLELGVLAVSVIALLTYPQSVLTGTAIIFSLALGYQLSSDWSTVLLALHPTAFDRLDPLFARDIGFYIFSLPILQRVEFWLVGLALFSLLAIALMYLLSGNSLSNGRSPGLSWLQQRHLCGLSGSLMLTLCLSAWLSRYELLYAPDGAVFGAGYTDVAVRLPAYTALSIGAGAIAIGCFWHMIQREKKNSILNPQPSTVLMALWVGYAGLAIGLLGCLPMLVQQAIVQPNELTRERPFIQRTIQMTREAFHLDRIKVENFDPTGKLTYSDLQTNAQTIRNIRLWDTRPLLATNRQLQQIRSYYRFFDADIDRYALADTAKSSQPTATPLTLPASEQQQVLIAARELDYNAVPPDAQTWVNEHLVYTHGYGFTLSPVNKVAPGGLPDYYVKDIATQTRMSVGNLTTSSETIRQSIPIGQPRIYYGEITDTYVMTGAQVPELDYPSGEDNVYNTYDGKGGISIDTLGKRWLFARYLHDWQMVLTTYFRPQTKLLFRRNINDRIRAIAPFLHYDQDPYLVVANVPQQGNGDAMASQHSTLNTQNYLYWIVDAYTTSPNYPYSDPGQVQTIHAEGWQGAGDRFNYIRNSVKVVIDAYNGSVDFYIADPTDPIIQAWSAIFPRLFKPMSAMPAPLRSHIRYPADLFSIQAERLMTYHMTDPQVFYNQEDRWQIPNEIYGDQPQPIEPYFLITRPPTVQGPEEFVLLLPYKPTQRTNLTAWLAARSDGENYGKLLLYVFPKQQLVYGIEQIEARINQDPVISQKISLWNRQGSRALQGNLLVIPIAQSLLYVEPLYLEAERNSLPTLASVIVVYEDRIAMAETFDAALQAIFQPPQPSTPAIVRPVQ